MKNLPYILLFTLFSHMVLWGQDTCSCKDVVVKNQKNDNYNYNSLERLFPYEDVIKELDYTFVNEGDFYNRSFARKMTTHSSHFNNSTFYSFETVNFNNPFKVINSDSSLLLNLTPCKENDRFYLIKTSLNRQYPIRKRREGFDSTAYSFFTLFTEIIDELSRSEQYIGFEVCRAFLHNKFDYNTLDSLNYFISEINKEMGFSLSLINPEIDGDHYLEYGSNDYYVNEFIKEVEKIEDFDFGAYLFEKFVASTTEPHKINETEEKSLISFLSPYLRGQSHLSNDFVNISFLGKYMQDRYKVIFSAEMMNCEISPQVLRAWDLKKNKAIKDTMNNEISAEISMCFQQMLNFNMSNSNYKNYTFLNSQLNPSEIYNTGVIVTVKGALGRLYLNELIDSSWDWDIMEFFKNDSISHRTYINYIRTNLRGVEINTVDISIPFKKKHINIEARDFWVNNKLVTFRIKVKNEEANKMKSHLLKLGFDGVRIIKSDDSTELIVIKEKRSK
jgi:hypothetical protein